MDLIQSIDISVLRFIREFIANPVLDFLMPIITLIGEHGLLWIITAIILLLFKKTRKAGFVMALSLIFGLIFINKTIKPLVGRIRPYVYDDVPILIKALRDGSFPSGHTACCFEGAFSFIFCGYKKLGRISLILAILVAISRLYLYVHYPTDVIVGALLGVLFAYVSYLIVSKLYDMGKKSKSL